MQGHVNPLATEDIYIYTRVPIPLTVAGIYIFALDVVRTNLPTLAYFRYGRWRRRHLRDSR